MPELYDSIDSSLQPLSINSCWGAPSSEASKIIPTVLNVFENLRECYNFRKYSTYSLSRPDQLHQVITIKHIFISTHTCDNLLCF